MAFLQSVPPYLLEVIGLAGFALYVMNYGLLTMQWLNSNCAMYFAVNLMAASFVLIGLAGSFNLAAALIQGFFVVMSTLGLCLRLRKRDAAR
ncbi:hypothetical protein [uncultured Tateyamaria sp.]|uniref:CBU_0592 family membrane protein n=1 Tax=Tateyamaria sp. TaxID=1929288 RepID=UPI002636FB07|nr:hypothetical protein [uncultured Tateyamaria sp.]